MRNLEKLDSRVVIMIWLFPEGVADLPDWLHHASLVVGQHDGDEAGLGAEGGRHGRGLHGAR